MEQRPAAEEQGYPPLDVEQVLAHPMVGPAIQELLRRMHTHAAMPAFIEAMLASEVRRIAGLAAQVAHARALDRDPLTGPAGAAPEQPL